MISQGRKHQEKREKERERDRERERERDTFFRVACAQEFFSPYLSLNCSESKREASSFDLNIKSLTIYLLSTFFSVELDNSL
jgi:hypothetical protein